MTEVEQLKFKQRSQTAKKSLIKLSPPAMAKEYATIQRAVGEIKN